MRNLTKVSFLFVSWLMLSGAGCATNSTKQSSSLFLGGNPTNLSNKELCHHSLNEWSEKAVWETSSMYKEYVVEAKRRGLTEQRCADLTEGFAKIQTTTNKETILTRKCAENVHYSNWTDCIGTASINSTKITGNWLNGELHGEGTSESENGAKYVGSFKKFERHGSGVFIFSDGKKYVGEWKNNRANGKGTLISLNGDKSVGDWRGGHLLGDGYVLDKNGTKFSGKFILGKLWGKGTKLTPDGRLQNGFFAGGKFTSNSKSKLTIKPPKKPVERFARKAPEIPVPEQKPKKSNPIHSSSGSGFIVSELGLIVTNAHVVKKCRRITVGKLTIRDIPTVLISSDKKNDLALLKLVSTDKSAKAKSLIQSTGISVLPTDRTGFLRSNDARLGEKVVVAGYPYGRIVSSSIKITEGIVSATRGFADNTGQFQLDAAVQPGNSGGPIYDSRGNIVGVVVARINKLKMAKVMGSIPELSNFGIKASAVVTFLKSNGVPAKFHAKTKAISTEQIAEIAQKQTILVTCLIQ
jgi:S1-C subfamily serine protease